MFLRIVNDSPIASDTLSQCGPRPQSCHPRSTRRTPGDREQGTAQLLLRPCCISVLLPFCFPKEREALIWCSEHDKRQKHPLSVPSKTREVSGWKATSKHLLEFKVCHQWRGCPLRWPHHPTTLRWPLCPVQRNSWGLLLSMGHLGNGTTGLPPLAPLNSLSDD